jgi:hypothetical protein
MTSVRLFHPKLPLSTFPVHTPFEYSHKKMDFENLAKNWEISSKNLYISKFSFSLLKNSQTSIGNVPVGAGSRTYTEKYVIYF